MNARRLLRNTRYLPILALSGLAACSSPVKPLGSIPQRVGDGFVTIQVEKGQYTWAEVSPEGPGIQATVVNRTDRTLHAALGDGFDAAPEQATLYIAEGSDAFVEHWVPPSSWSDVERALLIEGVRTIELRPHRTYTLRGHLLGPRFTGVFQVRVRYFDPTEQPDPPARQDFSSTFVIR